MTPDKRADYWKANLRLLAVLLTIWFIVSYLFGILLVEPLNSIQLGGYPLGFWFAQQGSIYTFVILIFVYAASMNRLDETFDVGEDSAPTSAATTRHDDAAAPAPAPHAQTETDTESSRRAGYWKANLRLLAILLAIWFVVSYGFGILLVEPLNAIQIGGYPLGFWFAQQGSIYTFVALIFVYAASMNRLDRQFEVSED